MPQTKKPKREVRRQRSLQNPDRSKGGWAKRQASRRQGRRKKSEKSGYKM